MTPGRSSGIILPPVRRHWGRPALQKACQGLGGARPAPSRTKPSGPQSLLTCHSPRQCLPGRGLVAVCCVQSTPARGKATAANEDLSRGIAMRYRRSWTLGSNGGGYNTWYYGRATPSRRHHGWGRQMYMLSAWCEHSIIGKLGGGGSAEPSTMAEECSCFSLPSRWRPDRGSCLSSPVGSTHSGGGERQLQEAALQPEAGSPILSPGRLCSSAQLQHHRQRRRLHSPSPRMPVAQEME